MSPLGVWPSGKARALGARDRGFESHRPDHSPSPARAAACPASVQLYLRRPDRVGYRIGTPAEAGNLRSMETTSP
jgi:hypothetical protein